MALFRCGGDIPLDLTDSTNGFGVSVASGSSVTVPITKTPKYVWYTLSPVNTGNYINSVIYEAKTKKYYQMVKSAASTTVTFNIATDTGNMPIAINQNNVVITNTSASQSMSIGVVVFY